MLRIILLITLAIGACHCNLTCEPNPCQNNGVCSVVKPANAKQLPHVQCKCNSGNVGARCEQVDLCVTKNPCVEGKLCSLDSEFKTVCACPLGFHGANCTQRLCSIILLPTKVFVGKVYLDSELVSKNQKTFQELGDLAKKCNVTVNVKQSFTRLLKPEHDVPVNETALYIGRGIAFDLKDLNGKPAQSADSGCFLKGVASLGLVHTNGVIQDKEYIVDSAEYQTLKTVKQVGCALNNDLPQVEPSKLVGKWQIVGEDKNWEEFLKANEVGWFQRMALKVIKPDMEIKNDGKNWTVYMTSSFKNVLHEFTEGVTFYTLSPLSGSNTKHVITLENKNLMVENSIVYASSGERKVKITREIVGDLLIQTMYCKDVVCVRTYGRKA